MPANRISRRGLLGSLLASTAATVAQGAFRPGRPRSFRAGLRVGAAVPAPTKVLFEGDSIVATSNPDSWSRLWMADHPAVTRANYAVGGSQIADLVNRRPAALAYAPSHLIVGIGANDLGDDTTTYLSNLWAYTDPLRAAGAKVIVATVLPRTGVPSWSSKRANFRTALLAAVGTKIDDVIDFNASAMGVDGAESDATKYPDGLHPSISGHVLLKRIAAPVINHSLGIPNEPLDFSFAPVVGAALDSDVDSAGYTVGGLYPGESRPYSVPVGGKVRKNGGAFTVNGSGSVVNGDVLALRNHSSAGAATQTDASLTIGATTAIFSVTTAGAGARDWVPTDLGTKLALWLRPEGISGANASQMATWPDDSGNAVAVTGFGNSSKPTIVSAGLNGFKTVRFDSNAYGQSHFRLPTGYLTGRTAGAALFVARLDADPPSSAFGAPVNNWGSNGDGEFYPYSNGSVYSSFGSAARNQTPDVGPSLASWRFCSFHAATNDWRYYVDGSAILTLASNTFANGSDPRIGQNDAAGGMSGQIAELIDCTAVLTTAERQKVEGYLAWKYALQANLPAGHPFAAEKPTI